MEINKIYNENCLETMARMPDNFIDLTVTSPPYDNLRDYKGYSFDFESVAKELFRVTKKGGVVVWVVGDATVNGSESGTSFKQALFFMECGFKLHDTMIYYSDKQPFNNNRYEQSFEYMFVFSKIKIKTFNGIRSKKINGSQEGKKIRQRREDGSFQVNIRKLTEDKLINNIWYYQTGVANTEHPATFPEKLCADHIHSWSNEGDLIYDPFMGSGTTAKMAHLQKRNWIGSEISIEYVELANKRIKPYLAQTTLF